jgi:hypothetical protein
MEPRTRHTACHRKRHQNIITSRLIKLIHNTGGITDMQRSIHRFIDVNRRSPISVKEWPSYQLYAARQLIKVLQLLNQPCDLWNPKVRNDLLRRQLHLTLKVYNSPYEIPYSYIYHELLAASSLCIFPGCRNDGRQVSYYFAQSILPTRHNHQYRTALFWVITQRIVVISYRHFGITNGTIFKEISCSETSVINYHNSLRNKPKECSPHQLCGGSLKSRRHQLVDDVQRNCLSDLRTTAVRKIHLNRFVPL